MKKQWGELALTAWCHPQTSRVEEWLFHEGLRIGVHQEKDKPPPKKTHFVYMPGDLFSLEMSLSQISEVTLET